MSVFPVNRVPDILKRMDLNSSQAEAMKTCFGILAIMSREDSNKILIAKDGMDIILNAMTTHVDRTDVQESGCDLLWSLAFNSSSVKDIIAKHGGATVLVRALKRHSRSSDFLKSACGALSNMCQSKLNQEGVSSQGGLQPLVGSIHVHQTSAKLLPFIFDAIASIIVNNEENARIVSSLGIIPVVVASLSRHKPCMEVVKSGCHTLAILSDVKGQASKIAFAGGVPIILALLDAHPLYSDLHRVAAVVLLRMLQESAHVGREITCHEGIRILLNSLEKGGAQQDTVAAVTHILYTVTNPSSPALAAIESQLWLHSKTSGMTEGTSSPFDDNSFSISTSLLSDARGSLKTTTAVTLLSNGSVRDSPSLRRQLANATDSSATSQTGASALGGIVLILGQYSARRDVVRAACRLVNNLSGFANVVQALDKMQILDRMLECVSIHRDTKDVVDSTVSLIKAIHRKSVPLIQATSTPAMHGLLHIFKAKSHDEEFMIACVDIVTRILESSARLATERRKELDESRSLDNKIWEMHALLICMSQLQTLLENERESEQPVVLMNLSNGKLNGWSRNTQQLVGSILTFVESVFVNTQLSTDQMICRDITESVVAVLKALPAKNVELGRRLEKLLSFIDGKNKKKLLSTIGRAANGAVISDSDALHSASGLLNSPHSKSRARLSADDKLPDVVNKTEDSERTRASPALQLSSINVGLHAAAVKTSQSTNFTPPMSASERTIGEQRDESAANPQRVDYYANSKLALPKHPLKASSDRNSTQANVVVDRLLNCWPNHLERLNLASTTGGISGAMGIGRSSFFSQSNGDLAGTTPRMHICYESGSAAGKGLYSKCSTPVPYNVAEGGQGEPFQHSLTFDSEFESGNLLRVVQKGDAIYDLFLRSDLHTQGHTQWFYFAVANTHPVDLVRLYDQGVQVPPVRVRFNIVNLTKPDSLFNLGMRPVVYSCQDAESKGIGWIRSGSDISYYSNSFMRNNTAGEGVACYYTLSFTIEFSNPKDTVLIAYSYPFTMSDYRHHIRQILDRPKSADIIRQTKLCQTLSGDDCDLLVITNFKDKDRDRIGQVTMSVVDSRAESLSGSGFTKSMNTSTRESKANVVSRNGLKPALFISARVHPGETPASWMMKGMLDFLTSDCAQAKLLRQVFVIFIVPVLNPDGVTFGNNRCSLAGVDLNRQWKLPLKALQPTIFYLKAFMAAQRKIREVAMYIDLHGHSRKYNVFMYGCDDKKRPKPQVRAFPKFFSMHNIGRKYVCFADCSFHVKKGRESTARVVVAKDLNIPLSFTLEATFCGSNYGPLKHCHMNIGHMQEVGAALCDAILNFSIAEGQVKDVVMVPPAMSKSVAGTERSVLNANSESDCANVDYFANAKHAASEAQEVSLLSTLKKSNEHGNSDWDKGTEEFLLSDRVAAFATEDVVPGDDGQGDVSSGSDDDNEEEERDDEPHLRDEDGEACCSESDGSTTEKALTTIRTKSEDGGGNGSNSRNTSVLKGNSGIAMDSSFSKASSKVGLLNFKTTEDSTTETDAAAASTITSLSERVRGSMNISDSTRGSTLASTSDANIYKQDNRNDESVTSSSGKSKRLSVKKKMQIHHQQQLDNAHSLRLVNTKSASFTSVSESLSKMPAEEIDLSLESDQTEMLSPRSMNGNSTLFNRSSGSIVKSEYSDMLLLSTVMKNSTDGNSTSGGQDHALAKALAVANTFGLPRTNNSQK